MLWKIGWGFTRNCNMRCKHCYSFEHRETITDQHFKLRKSKEFIDFNKDMIQSINFGTGENVLDREWWELFRYIVNTTKIDVGLTTNGSLALFVKDYLDLIGKLNDLDVSIDFADPYKHNQFRGNKYAFHWAVETLSLARELRIPRTIVMVAMNINFNHENLDGLLEIASKYDALIRINIMRPTHHKLWKYVIPSEQFYEMLLWLLEQTYVVSISDVLLSTLLGERRYSGDFIGKNSLRILSDGYITPSTYLISEEWKTYNIFRENVDLSTVKFEFSNQIPRSCMKCELKEFCKGGVIDRRLLWHSTLDVKDPYCILDHKDDPEWKQLIKDLSNIEMKYVLEPPSLVHDGYLPTIILSTKEVLEWD